jgi:hypothetical protein
MDDECQKCLRQQPRLDYCIDCWDTLGFELSAAEARVKELESGIRDAWHELEYGYIGIAQKKLYDLVQPDGAKPEAKEA